MSWLRYCTCFVLLTSLFVAGCKESAEGLPDEQQNMKTIAILYGQYRAKTGRPPAKLEDFKKFLGEVQKDPTAMVKPAGDIDQFLISPRDKQPYVFLWNVQARTGMPDPVAYEQTGDGSTRWIAMGSGSVVDAGEEEFKSLVPNAK